MGNVVFKMRNVYVDFVQPWGGIYASSSTSTEVEVLSDEAQFYHDMRTAIREFDEEELQKKQQLWQEWLDSYIRSGLY